MKISSEIFLQNKVLSTLYYNNSQSTKKLKLLLNFKSKRGGGEKEREKIFFTCIK